MKLLRKTISLILTTDQCDEFISLEVGYSADLVGQIRQALQSKQCDWIKIKAMGDIALEQLLRAKCPHLVKQILPDTSHTEYRLPPGYQYLRHIWCEYRCASQYDA